MIVGWRARSWLMAVLCARCRADITAGYTHVTDDRDPPVNALCHGCHAWIMNLKAGERESTSPAAN